MLPSTPASGSIDHYPFHISQGFPTLGAVEDDPGLKVVAEIEKAMLNSSGNEEHIAGLEGMPLITIHELAVS